MIENVGFKNFKALRDVSVRLSPLTLIVGPNCSGKTSILEGLRYLTDLGDSPPEELFANEFVLARLQSSGPAGALGFSLGGRWNENHGTITLMISQSYDGELIEWQFELIGDWNDQKADLGREQRGAEFRYKKKNEPLLRAIRRAVMLRLDPEKLAQPGYSEHLKPQLEFDGSNLAAVLADIAIQFPDDYKEILERLRSVVPPVKSMRMKKKPIENVVWEEHDQHKGLYRAIDTRSIGYEVVLDFATGSGLVAAQASEGTLLTLGLLTILVGPNRPQLILIDELERGLHPKALGRLVAQIRELQREYADLQVIATTHSPYLVDHFEPSEVLLTTLRDDGFADVAPLDQHPDFARWKDEMKPGEFWSSVGEDWVSGRS